MAVGRVDIDTLDDNFVYWYYERNISASCKSLMKIFSILAARFMITSEKNERKAI